MRPVRFIHAADLHLDTAFRGLARQISSDLSRRLHQATFSALDRLVALCEEEKPDFLILAGDTYNQEDLSLRAQIAVRNACERLGAAGVRVFLAHGNHDPLTSRLKTLDWPDNVTVFGAVPESFPVYARPEKGEAGKDAATETGEGTEKTGAELLAVVHGISHAVSKENRNLAALFQRSDHFCPQIGVLHTSMGSADALYAPASVEDLVASGLDYWALGHAHEYAIVCREPLALYPGAPQGLHINETGPHGCVLVTLTPDGDSGAGIMRPGVKAARQFRALAPVGWHILEIDLSGGQTNAAKDAQSPPEGMESPSLTEYDHSLPKVERLIRERLTELSAAAWPGCSSLVVRLRLTGRSALDGELRRKAIQDELMDSLSQGEKGDVEIWIKDIQVETRPLFDRDASAEREDLLGEALRRADLWRRDESLFNANVDEALGDLLLKGRIRKSQGRPDREALLALLDEAERICADFLEND